MPVSGGVSTHSRPKAAGRTGENHEATRIVSTHSRPKAAGFVKELMDKECNRVSTHSRPKAAGSESDIGSQLRYCFNTQPPEGGWSKSERKVIRRMMFQHTAARRRLGVS